ncbi:hypothetical protein REG_1001 [Candidatus Regiella insecticola LSR1]|uniref:Uncharacterized protein n=1 Tax=Candidatus Regiella insecticola LSR1 TaxID=663321 RepID=E0WSR1_9ENTR|nr:hypothetical protein [Candidatus Regiella insecticola]EFL92030.1 hypothetical protein REG_1001 [Candidatus Regiella insecticola LSR1]
MNELTNIVHQHANQITAAVRQINALHTDLQAMERQEPEQMKLAELTEVHLKILSDITALQKNIMSSQSQIETLRITLKKIETTLWQKRVEEVRLSQLLALLRKYLLILCGLGAVLFIFSTKIDVIKIIAQILA